MSSDLRERLHAAAGRPRFDLSVEDLVRRGERARRRIAVASVAAGLLVVLGSFGAATWWWPDSEPTAPFIDQAPPPSDADGPAPAGDTSTEPGPDASTDDGGVEETEVAEERPVEPLPPGSLEGLRYVVNGPDGLRGDDGRVVWRTEPSLLGGLARDGQGGFAFTDEAGLWWRPAGADEPALVRDDVAQLRGIGPHDGDVGPDLELGVPLANTDLGIVALPTGELVAAVNVTGALPPLRTITAANGLTARITELEANRTPEGTIDQVTEPVRLVVERDGEPVWDAAIGTDYEPLVRLHDFDGQRVLLTRAAEEPAMAPESIVFLDLVCADCVEVVGTTVPVTVTLVGEDQLDEVAVAAPRQDLLTPMTTDAGVDELPDGRHLLVDVEVADDGGTVSGDLAIWFSTPVANRAAVEDGSDDIPVPNDYHVRNLDTARLAVPVASDVEVTSVWFHSSYRSDLEPRPIDYEWFRAAMRGAYEDDVRDSLRGSPWWVTVADGEVVRLDEQYVP